MNDAQFEDMRIGIVSSMHKYPKCRVASCDCDDSVNEWRKGCNCPGHWRALDLMFGSGKDDDGKLKWNLADAAASAEAGRPVRAS